MAFRDLATEFQSDLFGYVFDMWDPAQGQYFLERVQSEQPTPPFYRFLLETNDPRRAEDVTGASAIQTGVLSIFGYLSTDETLAAMTDFMAYPMNLLDGYTFEHPRLRNLDWEPWATNGKPITDGAYFVRRASRAFTLRFRREV